VVHTGKGGSKHFADKGRGGHFRNFVPAGRLVWTNAINKSKQH